MKQLIIILLFIPLAAFAQDDLTKQEKKELKKKEQLEKARATDKFLQQKQFVLEANTLYGKRGETYHVTSSLNFIIVDKDKSVIQIGSNTGMGYNGVGGITLEGSISNYEYSANPEKGRFTINMHVSGSTGSYDVVMNIRPDGKADARVTTLRGGQIRYSGYIASFENSRIYQGQTTY